MKILSIFKAKVIEVIDGYTFRGKVKPSGVDFICDPGQIILATVDDINSIIPYFFFEDGQLSSFFKFAIS